MIREVVLDTETTGLSHHDGHRIVEIGCVELINKSATGRTYHQYINPQRSMDQDATRISGLTDDYLKDFPVFSDIAKDFYNFIKDSTLVIHNAKFDVGFINSEFTRLSIPNVDIKNTIDTVFLSKKKFPGQAANLDAICRRFGIDLSKRTKHGALIDAELLAEVYIMLLGGRQSKMFNEAEIVLSKIIVEHEYQSPRSFPISEIEINLHANFLSQIKKPLWDDCQ